MKPIYLTDEQKYFEILLAEGFDVRMLSDPGDVRAGEVVFLGADAKTKARELIARGIGDHRLSYAQPGPSFGHHMLPELTKHLYWDDVRPLSEFDEKSEEGKTFPSGFGFLDLNLKFRWRLPELCICAGPYGSGKSLLAQILAMQFAHGAGRPLGSGAMLCAWEDIASGVRRSVSRFEEGMRTPQYPNEHHGEVLGDLLDRVHFVRRNPDDDRLIAWYMELVRYHRMRFGTRFFVLDPWNELDHIKSHNAQMETDYIRDMMKQFRRLVDKLQIVLIIVTHVPAKNIRGNGEIEPFKLAHAFGSVQFANKADRGLCVVRSKRFPLRSDGSPSGVDRMIIRQDKAKDEELMGARGTVCVEFDKRFHTLRYDAQATKEVQDIWKD